jgi:aminoglycoside phosphotransferase (APT) family kinase protein
MPRIPLGRLLGSGKEAQIFEYGSRVVKLYPAGGRKEAAFREAAILAGLEGAGLPVPVVWGVRWIDQRWGLVMDRIPGASFAERMSNDPRTMAICLEDMAYLHLRIHTHAAVRLGSMKTRLALNIRNTAELDPALRTALLHRLHRMRGGDRLCHGDFHPKNVLGEPPAAVVVDWLDATSGDPAADVCRSYLLLELAASEIAMAYLDTYCRVARISRHRVLRWLPFVAAGRLAENVPHETSRLLALCREAAGRARVSMLGTGDDA